MDGFRLELVWTREPRPHGLFIVDYLTYTLEVAPARKSQYLDRAMEQVELATGRRWWVITMSGPRETELGPMLRSIQQHASEELSAAVVVASGRELRGRGGAEAFLRVSLFLTNFGRAILGVLDSEAVEVSFVFGGSAAVWGYAGPGGKLYNDAVHRVLASLKRAGFKCKSGALELQGLEVATTGEVEQVPAAGSEDCLTGAFSRWATQAEEDSDSDCVPRLIRVAEWRWVPRAPQEHDDAVD